MTNFANANCTDYDVETFFPQDADRAGIRAARAICKGCPVIAECLEFALKAETGVTRWLGLLAFHSGDSRRDSCAGFPDLVISGSRGVIWREIKTETGRLRPEQLDWISRLDQGGADVGIWRPSDLQPDGGRIRAELAAIR